MKYYESEVPFTPHEGSSTSKALRAFFSIITGRVKLWENAHFILVDVPLNPSATKRVLPVGMRLRSPPTATLFVADYLKTAFTIPYREAALLVHVDTPAGRGVHCCWMLVDDDTAQIYGREILGYPKKAAEFKFEENGRQSVDAAVSRRDVEIVSVSLNIKEPESRPEPVLGLKTFNAGGLGQLFAFNPVWLFTPQEKIHESFSAEATLELAHSNHDPIRSLVADYANPLPARFAVVDIMGPGLRLGLPVGAAGLGWFAKTYNMRYR